MNILTTEQIAEKIRQRHSLASTVDVRVKHIAMEVKADDADDHSVRARITATTLDRDDEVISAQGVDSSEFEKSGAIFWNHDYDKPVARPVGKLVRGTNSIEARAMFARRPADFQGEFFADYVRALVKQGIVKGVSIGFTPIESRNPTARDRELYGPTVIRVFSKVRLFEWSFAPMQSNPDAMVLEAVGKGLLSPAMAKAMFHVDAPEPEIVTPTPETKSDPITRAVHHELDAPIIKHVRRIIDDPERLTKASVPRIVRAVIDKARGSLYGKERLTDAELEIVRKS